MGSDVDNLVHFLKENGTEDGDFIVVPKSAVDRLRHPIVFKPRRRWSKKLLYWPVLILWIGVWGSIYGFGLANSWIFHDESSISYKTNGMTQEESGNFTRDYVVHLVENDASPKFVIDENGLWVFSDEVFETTREIINPEQYGIYIDARGQSSGMMEIIGISGAFVLVFGGALGMVPLYYWCYDKEM